MCRSTFEFLARMTMKAIMFLMYCTTDIQPTIHSTDTHGANHAALRLLEIIDNGYYNPQCHRKRA